MLIEKCIVKTVLLAVFAFASMAGGGLIAHFKFDGNLYDTSGNGYSAGDGQLYGDTHYVTGKSGQALDFDGDGDYIQLMVAPGGAGQTVNNQTAITVSMWIRMDAYPSGDTDLLMSRKWNGNDTNVGFHSYFGLNRVYFIQVDGVIPDENPLGMVTPDMLGDWVHIATTYDALAGQAYIYINGVPGAMASIDSSRRVDIGNYTLGGNALWNIRYFKGQIDEVRIYDYALDPAEIQVLYHEFDEIVDSCGSVGYLPGDLNYDCQVDLKDIAVLAGDWLKCTMPEDIECVPF